ncbi:MAG: ABC transporter permease [Clostridia bacterium]|nr:ABC transporter permease [Clostridia bacterium]
MRQETLRRFVSLGLLILLVIIFGVTSDSFFTARNIYNLLRECSVIGILAIGVTMIIITGGNDLSCGSLMGAICMVIAHLIHYTEMNLATILFIAFLAAIAGGLLNGFSVAILRIPDFIATLSSKFIFIGVMYILAIRTEFGQITTESISDPFIRELGGRITSGPLDGLYWCTLAFIAMVIIAQFILKNTRTGINIYAVGSNRNSAEISGISAVRTKFTVFLFSAICAFVGALFFLGRNRAAETASGIGLEFKAISATVIGGCAFSGGRGDMIGTLIGVLFMRVLENGILKFGFPTQTQQVITGVVIVAMLIFDAFYNEYMLKKTRKSSVIAEKAVIK